MSAVVLAVTTTILAPSARAQPSRADLAMAETLFREGKQLMDQGKYAQACPKVAESLRLDPGAGGAQLTLALCHEGEGKTATAWTEFNEAVSLAERDGREDREQLAREHLAAIEPKLSKLVVQVDAATAALPGLHIERDGAELGRAIWSSAVPVDPGEHTIVARADGYEPWTLTVLVGAVSDRKTVIVPALTKQATAAAAPVEQHATKPEAPVPSQDTGTSSDAPVVGYVVGGIGIASLAVGSYFGLKAMSKRSEVDDNCPNDVCPDQATADINDEATSAANISNVTFALGLVGTAVGGYLIFFSGDDETEPDSASVQWSPTAGRDGAGVTLMGRF